MIPSGRQGYTLAREEVTVNRIVPPHEPAGAAAPVPGTDATVLAVEKLRTEFRTPIGPIAAVDGLSFDLRAGETICIVGESGCGKSVTALSILRLVSSPPGRIAGGRILFGGRDLLAASEPEMEAIRGNEISMIFQEPMTSLNPLYTVGRQIAEAIALHRKLPQRAAMAMAADMLRRVAIPDPEQRIHSYPHQLSGGMRQRVMIAMALSCTPRILIADEPTTALDVTIQAQILDLIREQQDSLGTAVLLITHDMGVVAENADRVVVMYAGRKVEEAPVAELFNGPAHPYTQGLLGSLPRLDEAAHAGTRRPRLVEIKGMVPSLLALPAGCRFAPRCPLADARCHEAPPPLEPHGRTDHLVACWHAGAAGAPARGAAA
jgi:oligopeptide/dipeptide ABC transporter ATP-binding protein